jgi:hypothetical protein
VIARGLKASEPTWHRVGTHPAVISGTISESQLREAARRGRCRVLWLSSHALRVHRDALDDIAAAGKPSQK